MRIAALSVFAACSVAMGQVINPDFGGCYAIRDLGSPPGVPGSLGGITFLAGNPNVLLIGGGANGSNGAIYRIGVTRNANGSINGWVGTATLFSTAPYIDGGLAYGPGGVLFFTTYNDHTVGQVKPGSTTPDRIISFGSTSFAGSLGTLQFVPPGFPGAGQLKMASYNSGQWVDASVSPDGAGTYDINLGATNLFIGGGPEGIVFVEPGSPGFVVPSILVSEYGTGRVVAYDLDANGDPVVASRRTLISGLGGAEGGTRDPMNGQFLFSTFGGGDRVLVVTGFVRDCRVNINGDCSIDFNDYLEFLNLYNANDPSVDFNDDGLIDFNDYLEFLNLYNDGCPF